jgi:prepilin-type N-terminal cleavage/methylation domain-containing protein
MRPSQHGFTLVELVVVMVIVAVGLLGLTRMFNDNVSAVVSGEDVQRAAQYAQECTERILALRRNLSYFGTAEITSTVCDTSTLPAGFTRAVTFVGSSDPYTGTSSTACPTGRLCRDVLVTVTKGSVSAQTTVMLVAY